MNSLHLCEKYQRTECFGPAWSLEHPSTCRFCSSDARQHDGQGLLRNLVLKLLRVPEQSNGLLLRGNVVSAQFLDGDVADVNSEGSLYTGEEGDEAGG